MKRTFILAVAFSMLISLAVTCRKPEENGDDDTVHVNKVTLSETSITLGPGAWHTLTVTLKPDNAANKNVLWESADKDIATVDNGLVKGVKDGVTTVSATSLDGFITAECKVTVKTVNATSLTLDVSGELLMKIGDTRQLKATLKPDNATAGVLFSSSKSSVASVEAYSGLITAKAEGKTTITAKSTDGKTSASVDVSVYKDLVYPTSIAIVVAEDHVAGRTVNIGYSGDSANNEDRVEFTPANTTIRSLKVTSSNKNVIEATVLDNVVQLKTKAAGNSTLTFTTANGKTVSKTLYVWNGEPKITIDTSDKKYWSSAPMLCLNTGTGAWTHQLKVNFENMHSKSVTYTSSNPSALQISSSGVAKALKKTTNQITVTVTSTTDPRVSATAKAMTWDCTSFYFSNSDKYQVLYGPGGADKSVTLLCDGVIRADVVIPSALKEYIEVTTTTNLCSNSQYYTIKKIKAPSSDDIKGDITFKHKEFTNLSATITVNAKSY